MGSCFTGMCHGVLPVSSYITEKYERSFVTKTAKGKKKEINVNVLNAARQWTSIRAIADSGNDVTIFNATTARQLGFGNPNLGEPINVRGIHGGGSEFRMIQNFIQFGRMQPTLIRMAFAVNDTDLPPGVNLIGNKDILDSGKYEVVMDDDSFEIREKMPISNIDNAHTGGQMANTYVTYNKYIYR